MDVGPRGFGVPARAESGKADRGSSRPRGTTILLLSVAVLILAAWLLVAGLAASPAVSTGEASFAARAFAVNRFGYDAARLPWYDGGLAALQVAGYETVSGLRRSTTAMVAAREAMAVAALLAAAALTLAARRLRLSGPAVVAVPVLFGLTPAAILLHRVADPAQLGVLWSCVALALATGEGRRTGAALASTYLLAAVATAPLVLIALIPLFTTLLWSGDLGRLASVWRWAIAAAGLVAWEGLVLLAARGNLPGRDTVPPLTVLDVVLAVGAVAGGVIGLRVRWLRPLAVGLLATGIAAAVAAGIRGSLLIVALPLAAVVLPAAAEVAVATLRARSALPGQPAEPGGAAQPAPATQPGQAAQPAPATQPGQATQAGQAPRPGQGAQPGRETHPGQAALRGQPALAGGAAQPARSVLPGRSVPAATPAPAGGSRRRGVVVLAAVGALLAVLAWVPPARHLTEHPDASEQAIDGARDWVVANLPSQPRLAVDDLVWAALVNAGYPADQLTATGEIGPNPVGWPGGWAETRFVVGQDRALLGADPADAARLARQNSSPVAAFGEGDTRVEVRRVVTDPNAAADALRDASARIDAGSGLARNPLLGLRPEAAALLRQGAVDSRVLSVLAAITGQHALAVVDFPVVPGEDTRQPRRMVAVRTIDGEPARPGAGAVAALDQWLRAQQPPYRPAGVELADRNGAAVLLIRFDALGTTGLLPP